MSDERLGLRFVKAYTFVGRFLWHWAMMENHLREALGKALALDSAQARILSANIQLRNKIHILKTVINANGPTEAGARLIVVLNDIANYSPTRNMMAHDLFGPSNEGAETTEFLSVKATGELRFPDNKWTDEDFEEAYRKIDGLSAALKADMGAIRRPIDFNALAGLFELPSSTPTLLGGDSPPSPPASIASRWTDNHSSKRRRND